MIADDEPIIFVAEANVIAISTDALIQQNSIRL